MDAGGDPTRDAIEVFATGRTLLVEHDDWASRGPDDHEPGDRVRRARELAHDLAREHHARPGRRPGQQPVVDTTSRRRGGGCDIVRPVLLSPIAASVVAVSGGLLREPVPNLEVELGAGLGDHLAWRTRIVGPGMRPVPAMLHLLGTPSGVVTVIELVPVGRVRWGRDRVVEHGVRAVEALAARLTRLAHVA